MVFWQQWLPENPLPPPLLPHVIRFRQFLHKVICQIIPLSLLFRLFLPKRELHVILYCDGAHSLKHQLYITTVAFTPT